MAIHLESVEHDGALTIVFRHHLIHHFINKILVPRVFGIDEDGDILVGGSLAKHVDPVAEIVGFGCLGGGELLPGAHFCEHVGSGKSCGLKNCKRNICLFGGIGYRMERFVKRCLNIFGSFAPFYGIVEDGFYVVLGQLVHCVGTFGDGFAAHKLLVDGWFYNPVDGDVHPDGCLRKRSANTHEAVVR